MSESTTIDPVTGADSLADQVAPVDWPEFIGQPHLTASDAPLGRAIEQGELRSLLLLGPAGSGKTTLARLVVSTLGWQAIELAGNTAHIGDIRDAFAKALKARRGGAAGVVVIVVDVDALSLAAQDALLLCADEGGVTFIATAVDDSVVEPDTRPLARVPAHQLDALDGQMVATVVERVLASTTIGAGDSPREFDDELRARIVHNAHGSIRRALDDIESIVARLDAANVDTMLVTCDTLDRLDAPAVDSAVETQAPEDAAPIDSAPDMPGADVLADSVADTPEASEAPPPASVEAASADPVDNLRGAIRQSLVAEVAAHVRAALAADYTIDGLGRILLRMASEEIGNADPGALRVVLDASDAAARLGESDGEPALAQAAQYLAKAPKLEAE